MRSLNLSTLAVTLLLSAASSPADAADIGLSLESGVIGTSGEAWDIIGGGGIDTIGVGGSFGLNDNFQAVASLNLGVKGAKNYLTDPNSPGDAEGFVASLTVAQLSAGIRYDLLPEAQWVPFAAARGELMLGNMRLDDDPQHDDNINQIEQSSISAGGNVGLGVAWQGSAPLIGSTLRVELEGGFGVASALSLGELGDLDISGARVRGSVGVLF
jgi:hypothetical protein